MGMCDDIRCEYPLPLPADQGELAGLDWAKQGLQTKDLGQGMGEYCIHADGTLWLVGARWLHNELSEPNFRKDFFGTVELYDFIYGKKHDYRVAWEAVFAKGKLKDVRLKEWELEDNSERLKFKAEREAEEARRTRFLQTWFGRSIYPAYAWLIGTLVETVIGKGLGKAADGLHRFQRFAWRLESWLAPHGNPIRAKARQKKLAGWFSPPSTSEEEE